MIAPRPPLVVWELTRACPYACRHCRRDADPYRHPCELSTLEAMRVMNEVRRLGEAELVLTGGEPAERPDLVELVRHAGRIGLRPVLETPGTARRLSRLLPTLRDGGLAAVSVGLDGADEDDHDGLRGAPGSYRRAAAVLGDARSLEIPTRVTTLVTRRNLDAVDELVPRIEEAGAELWTLSLFVPASPDAADEMPSAEEVEAFLRRMTGATRGAPFDVRWECAPHARRVWAELRRNGDVRPGLVPRAGDGLLFVGSDGVVYPSRHLPVPVGDVRTDDVAALYRSSPVLRALRDRNLLEGKCGGCDFREACGGSRARAYASTGSWLDEDPACAYRPEAAGDAASTTVAAAGRALPGERDGMTRQGA